MLKEAKYRCWEFPAEGFPEFHKVAYVITGEKCYFSGLERGNSSTILAAEDVIMAIAQQENVLFTDLRYFDIQTYKGYRKIPGEYEVNELEFEVSRKPTEQEEIELIEKCLDCKVVQSHGNGPKTVEECEIIPDVRAWGKAFLTVDVLELFKEHIGVDFKQFFPEVCHESEGLFCVCDENYEYYYVHPDGTPAFEERYFDLTKFKNGLAWVCSAETLKWAQIDHEGNVKSEWIDVKEL